jgi:hypothetical protein
MNLDAVNAKVLAYLKDKSAHSDIAGVLHDAVRPLGDVQVICPDREGYGSMAVATQGVIFGFAIGMDTIAFRLDDRMRERAMICGGVACSPCGKEWIAVVHHRPDDDWPKVDVRFWARKAYVGVREGLTGRR